MKITKSTIACCFLLLITTLTQAQVGIGTITPNASAQLDVNSSSKGFLPPRMTSTERDAIINPATGLVIYNTTTSGLEIKTSSTWMKLVVPTDNVANVTGIVAVANGGTGVTTSTGTGTVVLSNSPTLVTPDLGTPSSLTLSNATGLPISSGVSGLASGVATFLATPSSSNFRSALIDKTGTGATVFASSPTFVTPNIGDATASSINGVFVGRRSNVNYGPLAIGYQALNSIGSSNMSTNTAVGYLSMYNTNDNGDFNTAVGNYSLFTNTTGSWNSALGKNALIGNTTGTDNTAIGESALRWNTTGSNNVAIGSSAQSSTSNTTGSQNILIGSGTQLQGNYNNSILIGYNLTAGASNLVRIGNYNSTSYGIYGTWINLSDERAKHSITNLEYGTNLISLLKPVRYIYNNDKSGAASYGFLAQDVKSALSQIGDSTSGIVSLLDDQYLGMKSDELIPVLVKAIQEQQQQIQELSRIIQVAPNRKNKRK